MSYVRRSLTPHSRSNTKPTNPFAQVWGKYGGKPSTHLETRPLTCQRGYVYVNILAATDVQDEEQQQKAQRESDAKRKEQEAFAKMEAAKKNRLRDEEARRAEVRGCPRYLPSVSCGGKMRQNTVGVGANELFPRFVDAQAALNIRSYDKI